MKKRIVMIGGSIAGIKNFSAYIREDEALNSNYREYVDDLKDKEYPLCVELEQIGSKVNKLLNLEKVHTLIVNEASAEVRKIFVSEKIDVIKNLEVYRIWFNEKEKEEIPEEYDYVVDPNSQHFTEILDNIFSLG